MMRVGFIGVPGAGKTSTARALAAMCRQLDGVKNVELVAEYARRYITKHGGIKEPWEQIRILNKQLEWEDAAAAKADLIITDSPVHLGLAYTMLMPHRTAKDIMLINDLFSMLTKLDYPCPRYDIIFHIPPLFQPVKDGVRAAEQFDPAWRIGMDERLHAVFLMFPPARLWALKSKTLESRANEAAGIINLYIKEQTHGNDHQT